MVINLIKLEKNLENKSIRNFIKSFKVKFFFFLFYLQILRVRVMFWGWGYIVIIFLIFVVVFVFVDQYGYMGVVKDVVVNVVQEGAADFVYVAGICDDQLGIFVFRYLVDDFIGVVIDVFNFFFNLYKRINKFCFRES